MAKLKKIIAILLILTFVPIGSFADYLTDEQKKPSYDQVRNVQMWSVENKEASSGTRYRTLAFKAKIKSKDKVNGKDIWYTANTPKMDDPEKFVEHKPDKISIYHYMNYVSNTGNVPPGADSLYKSFYRQYKNDDQAMAEINELFSKGGYMYLDSVGTVTDDGKQRGEIDAFGYAKKGDEKYIYDTKYEFLKSAPWQPGTQKTAPNMFDIKIEFPPQPVITPVPHITKGTETADVTSVEYKEGEVIDLVGINSFFPKAVNREYEWNYKKKGATTWIPCGKKATPDLTSLPIGEYDITLDVQYTMSAFWGDKGKITRKSVAPATCVIKVIPNSEIVAIATVSSPADIEIESDATYANVPVTLNSNLMNLGGGKVKSVTYQLMTEEGSPIYSETFSGSETLSKSKTFKITYKGEPFTQGFKGQVTYVLESGTNKYSKWATSTTYIHKKGIGNLPPVPIISPIPDTISGNDIRLNGASSYDPDGQVVSWEFSIPQWGYYYNEEGKKSTWKTTIGYGNRVQAILGVTDDDGAYSETSTFFNVTPPPPMLNINVSGALKENRKVIFNSNVTNLSGYTTTDSQVEWTVSSLDGQMMDKIKLKATIGKSIQGLFKEKGQYLVECKATNNANMTAEQSIKVNISEDLLPTVVVDGYDTVYRNDEKQAEIKVFDNSYSIDNDYVATRYWYYAFDKDHDGIFDDETLTFLKSTTLPEDNALNIPTNQVGKYKIYLRVQEGFGQETIPEFVTASDYKINSSYKIIEVQNYKPVVSFVPMKDKKVDVVVVTDYTGDKLKQLGTRLNEYVGESFENGLNVKLQVATDSKYVGRYTNQEANGFQFTNDEATQKYQVALWGKSSKGTLTEYSDGSYVGSFTMDGLYFNNHKTVPFSGVFPARVKQASEVGSMFVVLLENGDLYGCGTSANMYRGRASESAYFNFTKLLSNVKELTADTHVMYALTTTGDIYAAGEVLNYKPLSAFFYSAWGELKMSSIFTTSYWDSSSVATHNSYGGELVIGTGVNEPFWKMPQFKNATYMIASGSGLVVRDSSGDWYGFGSGLANFGHNTGFIVNGHNVFSKTYNFYNNGNWPCTAEIFDYQNSVVKLTNLSNLDKTLGGIDHLTLYYSKYEYGENTYIPPKLYSKKGDVYTYSTTTNATFDGNGFNLNSDGVFTYTKIGTWNPKDYRAMYSVPNNFWFSDSIIPNMYIQPIKHEISQYNNPINIADYGPNEAVHEYAKSFGLVDSWTGTEKIGGPSSYTTTGVAPPPSIVRHYYYVPSTFIYGGISDFSQYSYAVEGTLVSYSVGRTEGRKDRDDTFYWAANYKYKVVGFKKEPNSTYVAGWKFYGVDLAKLPSTTFRPNSEKYILYLGEKDSFQKIGPSIQAFIRANNIKVKVATDSRYVDRVTAKSVEINLRDMINATPNGKLYPTDGLETMLTDLTEENKVFTEAQDGLYVIKGEDTVTYTSYFNDIESDTKLSEIYNHLHTSAYFENGEGQSVYHDVKRTAPVTVFDKVGLYNVFYRAKDQPSTDIKFQNYNKDSDTAEMKVYVHRRPIAQMNIQYCNYAPFSMTVTDKGSYDLDHQSQSARGISEVEWQYRKSSDKTWQIQRGPLGTSIKIASIPKGEKVLVYYRVKDLEGAWSKPVFEEVTPEVRLLMDAALIPEKPEHKLTAFPTGNNVVFKDLWSSYPYSHHLEIQMYDGKTPLLSKVLLTKEKGNVKTESPYPERTWKDVLFYIPQTINGKLLEDKTYTFVVKAMDSEDPTISKEKLFSVTTVNNRPPTVAFTKLTPSPLYEGDQHEVSLKVDDPDKDALKLDVYLKYDQKPEVLYQSFTNLVAGQGVNLKPLTVEQGKTIQWRGVVTDPKGERAESKRLVPIEAFGIDSISVKGAWQHWRGQKNAFGQQMTNEPNRFLSMEKVTFSVNTRGAVNKVSLNLSPELEAMSYKDSKGHVYYYKDEVGYDVKFPLSMKLQSKDLYQTSYILPFADSTQTWENKRLKKAYRILVTIENGERKRTLVYGDQADEVKIDITGNIFDLLYNQPTKLKK